MEHKATFAVGSSIVLGSALAYGVYRYRRRELVAALERHDFEHAEALTGELLDMGELGRDVRVLVGLLALCLVGMLVLQPAASASPGGGPPSVPDAYGLSSYR